jgi:ferritin
MISPKMEKLLNEQFLRELFSANQYLSISSYYESLELDGFANFFRIQAQEELMHAMKQFDYLHQVDGRIIMDAIPRPVTEFHNIKEGIELSLKQEREITRQINSLMKEAMNESDFATQSFLQWFINEQVEEEAIVNNVLRKLELIGDNTSALYLLNEELKRRQPEPPAGGAANGN